MIIYDLLCENDHRMEGWFAGPEDFECQLERGLIRCPHCDTPEVRRVPSAVAVASGPRGDSPGLKLLWRRSPRVHKPWRSTASW